MEHEGADQTPSIVSMLALSFETGTVCNVAAPFFFSYQSVSGLHPDQAESGVTSQPPNQSCEQPTRRDTVCHGSHEEEADT